MIRLGSLPLHKERKCHNFLFAKYSTNRSQPLLSFFLAFYISRFPIFSLPFRVAWNSVFNGFFPTCFILHFFCSSVLGMDNAKPAVERAVKCNLAVTLSVEVRWEATRSSEAFLFGLEDNGRNEVPCLLVHFSYQWWAASYSCISVHPCCVHVVKSIFDVCLPWKPPWPTSCLLWLSKQQPDGDLKIVKFKDNPGAFVDIRRPDQSLYSQIDIQLPLNKIDEV